MRMGRARPHAVCGDTAWPNFTETGEIWTDTDPSNSVNFGGPAHKVMRQESYGHVFFQCCRPLHGAMHVTSPLGAREVAEAVHPAGARLHVRLARAEVYRALLEDAVELLLLLLLLRVSCLCVCGGGVALFFVFDLR